MNYAAKKNFARVLVVGQGRFGSGLFQGVSSASVRGYSGVEVDHMSAKAFCTLSVNSMAEMLKPYKFLMYAGYNLHAQIANLSEAMLLASPDATLEILDFTNPEPGAWDGDDIGAAYGLKMILDARDPHAKPFAVWKVTEVRQMDSIERFHVAHPLTPNPDPNPNPNPPSPGRPVQRG